MTYPTWSPAAHSDLPAAYACEAQDYWITSVASWSTAGGMVSPIARAALRLTTKSNVVGCSTGRSAGFAPLRILST